MAASKASAATDRDRASESESRRGPALRETLSGSATELSVSSRAALSTPTFLYRHIAADFDRRNLLEEGFTTWQGPERGFKVTSWPNLPQFIKDDYLNQAFGTLLTDMRNQSVN